MNAEIKQRWVEALRSGKYPQTTGVLHAVTELVEYNRPAGYCCLGVLCDLLVPPDRREIQIHTVGIKAETYEREVFDEADAWLPIAVMKQAGLARRDPRIEAVETEDDRITFTLSELNDMGFSFAQIADVVEYFL